uniref:DUF3611 family protein n=2 Tax=Lotharella globosa TaxID=91324 RepID=A0A6U3D2B3_9EUKA
MAAIGPPHLPVLAINGHSHSKNLGSRVMGIPRGYPVVSRTVRATTEGGSSTGRVGGKVPLKLFGGRSVNWQDVPNETRGVTKALWRGGWTAWWCQLILTAISTVTLTFAATVGGAISAPLTSGLVTSAGALVAVIVSWGWMYHFTRLAIKLVDGADVKDKLEGATRTGVKINLLGMGLALVSAEQIVGSLVATALTQGNLNAGPGVIFDGRSALTLEAFVLQSNTNILLATFVGLLISWWANQAALRKTPVATTS